MSILDLVRRAQEAPPEDPVAILKEAEAEARTLLESCEKLYEGEREVQEENDRQLRAEVSADVASMEAVRTLLSAKVHQRLAVQEAREAAWQARQYLGRARQAVRNAEAEKLFPAVPEGIAPEPTGKVLEFRQ